MSLKDIVAPTQTALVPKIEDGVEGTVFTFIVAVAFEEPHILDSVYNIFTVPTLKPFTIPVLPTVAIDVLELLHAPPVLMSLNVIVEPEHTLAEPVMPDGADGIPITLTA